jgi:protein-S-isoprenylcysteine O-methyltransferase Ste14
MDKARYYVALITVVAFPPPLLAWLIIHPLAGRLRRLRTALSYLLIFAFYAAGMISIWLVRDHFMRVDFGFSVPLSTLAVLFLGLSIYFRMGWRRVFRPSAILGLPEIRGADEPGKLVTGGIYARVRNPRYLEVGLGIWAMALFSNYAAALALAVAYIPLIYLVVVLEERELGKRFGAAYDEYCARVPRFIPRIGSGGRPRE